MTTRTLNFSMPTDVDRPKASGYGARIGEQWVRLAPGPEGQGLRYYTKDSLAPRQDMRGSTAQNVLDIGYPWGRTELNGGEGLDWDPRELSVDDATAAQDPRRFWDSKNVDVEAPAAGYPYTLTLTNLMEDWDGGGTVTDPRDIAASSDYLYVADSDKVLQFNSWDHLTPTSHSIGTTISMMAVSTGDEVAVVTTNGQLWYKPSGGVFVQLTGVAAFSRGVWFVKGRFVVFRRESDGSGGELGEVDTAAPGALTVFDTLGAEECHSVVSSGSAIVAAVSDGTIRSYVPEQGNQTDPSSVNVVIRGRTDMPKGEVPFVLGSEGGILTVLTMDDPQATTKITRFYRAEVLSAQYDYVVGGLQLQREWLDSKEKIHPQNNMSSVRDAIYFTVNESDGNGYVWRYDLTTLGLSRHNTVGLVRDAMFATVVYDGQGAVIDHDDDDDAVVRLASDTKYNDFGYLISPNITFGLNTDIAWIASVIEGFDLSGGAYIDLWRSTDPEAILDPYHPTWTHVQRVTADSQSGVEIPMIDVKSRTLTLQVRIHSTSGSDTPKLTRTAIRGIPTHRDWIVLLPVNVSDMVEVPGRMPTKVPGLGDALQQELHGMAGDSIELVVLDPPMLFRGVVDNMDQPVNYISDRGSVSTYCMVQFRGTRWTSTVQPVGEGLGLGRLGMVTLGVGDLIEVT